MTPRKHRRGSVLILALWLSAGLAAGALLAGHSNVLSYRQDANHLAATKADFAIDGLRRYAVQLIDANETPGEMPDVELYTAEAIVIGDCYGYFIATSEDTDADEPLFGLQDEAAKLNLNTATLEMLELLPGMTTELAAAIIDWRDTDTDLTANGAESDTYLALDPAYTAKDAPFESVDELRLLYAAESAHLTGMDRNQNFLIETWERELADELAERFDEIPDLGFLQLLTIHTREPNTNTDGDARTNLTGNPQEVNALLTELYGERAAAITTATAGPPVDSVLAFAIRGNLTAEEAVTAFDRFTTSNEEQLPGRVNVNTAPLAVLACLPGVGEDKAAELVAYRQENPDELTSPLWIVSVLGDELATLAGPWVTARTYQYAADIIAVGPRGRAFRRRRFVIDTTGTTPIVVAHQDLTHLGWPLGQDLYQTLIVDQGAPTQ